MVRPLAVLAFTAVFGVGCGKDENPAGSSANQNCADTAPRGGAGRIYCFARN